MSWQPKTLQYLALKNAPSILTRPYLHRIANKFGCNVGYRAFSHWIQKNIEMNVFSLVHKGLYINKVKNPPGSIVEAISYINPKAIVSMHYVLGEQGVTNNYTDIITAVVPTDHQSQSRSKFGKIETNGGTFHFYALKKDIFFAGSHKDRIATEKSYPCATPEKAFIDYFYLGGQRQSTLCLPNQNDIDLEELDMSRLHRIAKQASLEDALETWMSKIVDNEPYSPVLGF